MNIPEAFWKMAFDLCAGRLHKRFVAGPAVEDAVEKAKELKKRGIYSTINILGEHVKNNQAADEFLYQYLKLIRLLADEALDGTNIAVKPSQLGLEVCQNIYRGNLLETLKHVEFCLPRSLVEIDREEHRYAKDVREISLDLARRFSNQRVACQINLQETMPEIQEFVKAGISLRLCKGTAYPGDIKKEQELRKIFFEQAIFLSARGNRPAIATHDLYLIDELKWLKNLEFQVLLGIENKEMEQLVKQGKKVGFYVPCGSNWRPYGKRRAEAIVAIWLRNFFYRTERGLRDAKNVF